MDKVSVVITTYKREYSTIKRAIDSVIAQTYRNIEIAVVDDNADNSQLSNEIQESVLEYGEKVKYLTYEGNKGACFARNFGADYLTGKYVAFLDDDDVWHPNKIEKQVEVMESGDYSMVSCHSNYVVTDKDGNFVKQFPHIVIKKCDDCMENRVTDKGIVHGIVSLKQLLERNIIGGCSFPLLKREVFEKSGKFRVGLPSAQDYDLWLRMSQLGKIGYVDEALLDYYIHQSERITHNVQGKIQSYELLVSDYSQLAEDSAQFISMKYFYLARFCFGRFAFKEGFRYSFKAFSAKKNIQNFKTLLILIFGVAPKNIIRRIIKK